MTRSIRVRLALLVLTVAGLAAFALLMNPTRPGSPLRLADGSQGAVLFVAGFAVFALAGVPRNVLSTIAGAVFGFAAGLPLAILGSLAGAGGGFWIARVLGREAVGRAGGARAARVDEMLLRRGAWAVLAARLTPIVPFAAFNYLAGVSALPWRTYAWATAVGVLPGTVLYAAIGAYALAPGAWSLELFVAVAALAVAYLAYRVTRRALAGTSGATG